MRQRNHPLLLLLAVLCLGLVLASCGGDDEESSSTPSGQSGGSEASGNEIQPIQGAESKPTIMGGIRIALVSVIATATVAPLANVDTLGRPIVSPNVYGTAGQLAACIIVVLVTFAADGLFAALQRAVTPRGLKIHARGRSLGRPAFLSTKRSIRST